MTYKRNPGQERSRKELLTSGKRFCLIFGGSRSGKTFELLGTVTERALLAPGSRHLVVRQEATDAKRAIVHGTFKEMLRVRFPGLEVEWKEQLGVFQFPNGSEIWIGGLNDDKALEKILGNEYATIYINEASQVRYSAFTLLRTRLAQTVTTIKNKPLSQRMYVDLNPTTRHHWTYRLWIDGVEPESQMPVDTGQYGHVVVSPMDNTANLSKEYLDELRSLPPRAKKRFYDGTYVEDVEDALWRRAMIKRVQTLPPMKRIVVAIDPAVTNKAGSDETGIIAAGIDYAGNGYVIEDASARYRPEEWARQVLAVSDSLGADRVVAEVNQGGDMVESTIRAFRQNVPYRAVRASRGQSKYVRAEPVAALYERGKIYHAGVFQDLEDQMCLAAGSLIETARGQVPIEMVKRGDLVMTREGFAPVEWSGVTGEASEFVLIHNGTFTIEATPCHPIFIPSLDKFVSAKNVKASDSLLASPNWASTAGRSHGAAGGITGWRAAISVTRRVLSCIVRYGKRTAGKYLMECTSIMSTAIRATTTLPIWLSCSQPNTTPCTRREGGMAPVISGLRHPRREKGNGSGESLLSSNAYAVAPSWKPTIQPAGSFAISVAKKPSRPVYNLKVEDGYLPEYFANGILVHNCSFTSGMDRVAAGYSPDRVDALVWAFTDLFFEMTTRHEEDDDYDDRAEWGRDSVTGY